jgi:hypothetical protein
MRKALLVGLLLFPRPTFGEGEGRWRLPVGDHYSVMDSPIESGLRTSAGYSPSLVHGNFRYQTSLGERFFLGGDVPVRYTDGYFAGVVSPRVSLGTMYKNGVIRGGLLLPSGHSLKGPAPWAAEGEVTFGSFGAKAGAAVAFGGTYRPRDPAFQVKAGAYFGPVSLEVAREFGERSPFELILGARVGMLLPSVAIGVGESGPAIRGLLSIAVNRKEEVESPEPIVLAAPPPPEPQVVSIPDSVFANLGQVADVLMQRPEILEVRVEVHTEETGTGIERAVQDYLESRGVSPERTKVELVAPSENKWIDIVIVRVRET